jgi:hypothetical protein
MPETTTVYASIGNSDDKLTQERWSAYLRTFLAAIRGAAERIHGEWHSAPTSAYQNACVCFEVHPAEVADLRALFADLAHRFGQDSIAWAAVERTEFIS